MSQGHNTPSLYEMLTGNFTGGLDLHQVNEQNQVILSVLDNMQRILNCRAVPGRWRICRTTVCRI